MNEGLVDTIIQGTRIDPRQYQRRIVSKAVMMYCGSYKNQRGQTEPAVHSILIESPTGSGKTVMGWMIAKALQHLYPSLVVGWVAMRRHLLSQAAHENVDKGIYVRNAHMVSMFEDNPTALREARAAGHPILMVIDEAQHDATDSMANLHNLIRPQFVLGLSATPFRSDRMKLCFSKIIKDAGIHQLIQDGYLSRYHHYTIQNWTPENVAEHYLRDQARWGKSIFYFHNLQQCHRMADILRHHGVTCEVVAGNTAVEEQLEAFRYGDVAAVINCVKLTEGFDYQDLQTVFVRDASKGPTIQMSGRVLRKSPTIPYKQVVQSQETRWPFVRTAIPEQQWIWRNDEWLSLTMNPRLTRVNQNAILALATTNVRLPDYLLARRCNRRKR